MLKKTWKKLILQEVKSLSLNLVYIDPQKKRLHNSFKSLLIGWVAKWKGMQEISQPRHMWK
jgi:hypothetical protein